MKIFKIALNILFGIFPLIALAASHEVTIDDAGFHPATLYIDRGDTVKWINKGTSLHSLTTSNGLLNSGCLNTGVTFEHTFTAPGVVDYFDLCNIPPYRTGTITVVDCVTISPSNSVLHPQQRFDVVIFLLAEPSSQITIIFDGSIVFKGDFYSLLAIGDSSFNFPLEEGGSVGIPIKPFTLSPGVHTLEVKVIKPSGEECSDTVVYRMAQPIQGVL